MLAYDPDHFQIIPQDVYEYLHEFKQPRHSDTLLHVIKR